MLYFSQHKLYDPTGRFWFMDYQIQIGLFLYTGIYLERQSCKRGEGWVDQSSIVFGEINQD